MENKENNARTQEKLSFKQWDHRSEQLVNLNDSSDLSYVECVENMSQLDHSKSMAWSSDNSVEFNYKVRNSILKPLSESNHSSDYEHEEVVFVDTEINTTFGAQDEYSDACSDPLHVTQLGSNAEMDELQSSRSEDKYIVRQNPQIEILTTSISQTSEYRDVVEDDLNFKNISENLSVLNNASVNEMQSTSEVADYSSNEEIIQPPKINSFESEKSQISITNTTETNNDLSISKSDQNKFIVPAEATSNFNEAFLPSEHNSDFAKSLQDLHVSECESESRKNECVELQNDHIDTFQTSIISECKEIFDKYGYFKSEKETCLENMESPGCETVTDSVANKTFEENCQLISGSFEPLQSSASKQPNKNFDTIEAHSELVNDSVELSQTLAVSGCDQSRNTGEVNENQIDAKENKPDPFISVKESLKSPRSESASNQLIKNEVQFDNHVEPVKELIVEVVETLMNPFKPEEVESDHVESEELQNINISVCERVLESIAQLSETFEANESISESRNELVEEPNEVGVEPVSNPLNNSFDTNGDQPGNVDPAEESVNAFGYKEITEILDELNKTLEAVKGDSNHILDVNHSIEPPQPHAFECENIVETSDQLHKTFDAVNDNKTESLEGHQNLDIVDCENMVKSTTELNETFEATEKINEPVQTECIKTVDASTPLNKTSETNDSVESQQIITLSDCELMIQTNRLNKTPMAYDDHAGHAESVQESIELPQVIAISSSRKVDEISDCLNKKIKVNIDLQEPLQNVTASGRESAIELSEPLNKTVDTNEINFDFIESAQAFALTDCKKIISSPPLKKAVEVNDNQSDYAQLIKQSIEESQNITDSSCKKGSNETSNCYLNVTIEINKDMLQESGEPLQDVAALQCEAIIESSEPLNVNVESNEAQCLLEPQLRFVSSECEKMVETIPLNKTIDVDDNQCDHAESSKGSQIISVSDCNKIDETSDCLNKTIEINKDTLKESTEPLQNVAASVCEKKVPISEALNETVEASDNKSNHVESAQEMNESPTFLGCNKVDEIETMSENVNILSQPIEAFQIPGVCKDEAIEIDKKETLNVNDHIEFDENQTLVLEKIAVPESDFVESQKAVEALARSLNQTIDVEESAIAEDDELSDNSSNNLNVTVKVTSDNEDIAIEESELHSEQMVTEEEVALNTKSTEFRVDDIDGEKESENKELSSKFKRPECRRNIRALRNKTQVITDPLLLKIESTTNDTALVQDNCGQKKDELQNKVDRLLQELDSIHQANLQKDQLIISHALDRQIKKETIKKYEQVSEDYKNQIAKQHMDLRISRKQLDNFAKQFTSAEMAFSHVFEKYEKAKIVINGFRKNEASLTQNVQDAEFELAQLEAKCKAMEDQCKQNVKRAQDQVNLEKEKQKQNIAKLQAMVKRLEIKASSLETALKQKSEECQAIAALCDDITGRQPV